MVKRASLFLLLAILAACECDELQNQEAISPQYKNLNCESILLHINEAEYHIRSLSRKRSIKISDTISPICYTSRYSDSSRQIDNLRTRIEYLNSTYNVKNCVRVNENYSQDYSVYDPRGEDQYRDSSRDNIEYRKYQDDEEYETNSRMYEEEEHYMVDELLDDDLMNEDELQEFTPEEASDEVDLAS